MYFFSFFNCVEMCGNVWKVSHGIEGNDIGLPFPSLVMFPSLDIILRRVYLSSKDKELGHSTLFLTSFRGWNLERIVLCKLLTI